MSLTLDPGDPDDLEKRRKQIIYMNNVTYYVVTVVTHYKALIGKLHIKSFIIKTLD